MRIVIFPITNGVPDYDQFGGIGEFGLTEVVDGNCIGEYRGASPAGSLPDYGGAWPIPEPVEHRPNMTPGEFQLLFTADEFDIIDTARATDKRLNQLWSAMMSSPIISVTSPTVISAVAHLVTKLYITQARADVIMKGLPL